MSNNNASGLASLAGMIGKQGAVSVAPSSKGGLWSVPVKVLDVRSVFGRADYKVEPLAPALGAAMWVEAARFSQA